MGKKTLPALLLIVFSLSCSSHSWSSGEDMENEKEGVLETEDISVILQGSGLWIKITPMEDEILRYCTKDTRRTYSSMLKAQGGSLFENGEVGYKVFFVQFQGRSDNEIYFDPTELNIVHQGKLFQPERILPISSTFGKRILILYGNPEMAIYAFSKDIDLGLSLEFKYKDLRSNKWEEIIQTVEDSKLQVR
jgi:hypothetical protein